MAIKVLTGDERVETGVRQILREGRAAAAVRHPHVVSVLDVGREGETPYLVMEFLEGEDLARRLEASGPLAVREIADLLLPLASGMWAVHSAGVIHRDLKPRNVFLARRHRGTEPVIVDFGISRPAAPSRDSASLGGRLAGTVAYMAPEQLRASKEATPRTDQYALGLIAYECATGGTPFLGDDVYELMHAIMTAEVVPPSRLALGIEEGFDEIVLRALARDASERFPDVRAFGDALSRFASEPARAAWEAEFGRGPSGSMAASNLPAAPAVRGRRASRAWGAAVLALAVVVPIGVRALSVARHDPGAHASPRAFTAGLSSPVVPAQAPAAATLGSSEPIVRSDEAKAQPGVGPGTRPGPERHASPPARTRGARPSAPPVAPSASPGAPSVERGTANMPIVE